MEKRRIGRLLVASLTLLGLIAVAHADAPAADAQPASSLKTQARKRKRKAKPPKVTLACTTDADCAFTTMADGECCPTLCPPRVVSKTSADALEKYGAGCAKPNGGCPVAECMPPRTTVAPACVSGKCEKRAAANPTLE